MRQRKGSAPCSNERGRPRGELFIDVHLAGKIDGVELAHFTRQWYPNIHVVVTSGRGLTKSLPEGTTSMPKPWLPLDMLREVERSLH